MICSFEDSHFHISGGEAREDGFGETHGRGEGTVQGGGNLEDGDMLRERREVRLCFALSAHPAR